MTEFRISRRQYDIIVKQAVTNYPEESGGFLGGTELLIQAIMPVFNQHGEDKTGSYSVFSEDIIRAHDFFKKHNLTYYGIYHTHPDAPPTPSKQDIRVGQKYHFIVGLLDKNKPDFCAFEIINAESYQVPLIIVEDRHFSVIDIHAKSEAPVSAEVKQAMTSAAMPDVARDPKSEAELLSQLIFNIKEEKKNYPKYRPLSDSSDFSTLA